MSFGRDGYIRISDTLAERQIGCIREKSADTRGVAFSLDGQFIIHASSYLTKIWATYTQELFFHSNDSSACPDGISKQEALEVMRACEPKASWMWPNSREGDVFVARARCHFANGNATALRDRVRTNLLAFDPYSDNKWELSYQQYTFLTTSKGRLVICSLVSPRESSYTANFFVTVPTGK